MLLQTAQLAEQVVTQESNGNRIIAIITDADPIIQLTLFVLLFFSVVSWAIIFMKYSQIKTARRKVDRFIRQFWRAKTVDALLSRGGFAKGPATNIFRLSIAPLKETRSANQKLKIFRESERATANEVEQLESYVPFLATTASACPFIGLFGTTWGILNAFFELSAAGSSSLQVVGPSIAEALFATAIGLAAAIPAVVFYNFFVNKIRLVAREMEKFAEDLNHRIDTEYFAA